MSQVIRISLNLYERLAEHAKGFETPANVIERLLNYYEGKEDIIDPTVTESVHDRAKSLEIVYYPPDEESFKQEFLKTKFAYVRLHKLDGSTELREWRARNFQPTSSVNGNLRSGYLRGWRDKGIFKAEVSIDKKFFE